MELVLMIGGLLLGLCYCVNWIFIEYCILCSIYRYIRVVICYWWRWYGDGDEFWLNLKDGVV